jgi:ankyrin repeat protein
MVRRNRPSDVSTEQISKASQTRNISKLRRYGREGVKIVARSSAPIVNRAVLDGFLDVLRILVDHLGADLEEQSANHYTVLHFAAINMDLDLDIVRFLISKCKANISRSILHEACHIWVTPVTLAISAGNIPFLTCLIKEFDGNRELITRETAQFGSVDLFRFLVTEFKVDVTTEDERGVCCLQVAIRNNRRHTVHYILKHCHTKITTQVILWAVESGHVEMLQLFVVHYHLDISKYKDFLLAVAVNWNFLATATFLLTECQANTTRERNGEIKHSGLSPLAVAAKKSYTAMARLLVDHGADLNWRAKGGSTPLVFAAVSKNLELVKYFVEKGAEVNHRSELVGSVSEVLTKYLGKWDNRMDMVRYMMTEFYVLHGGENEKTDFKNAATRSAFEGGYLDVFRMLVQEFQTDISFIQDDLVTVAVKTNRVDMVEFLLTECHAKTTALDIHGFSPLCVAAFLNLEPMARCLTAHGADVSAKGPKNINPLTLAAHNRNLPLIKHFIHKGAQVNARAGNGTTYEILARYGIETSFLKYVKARESCLNPGCLNGGKKRCALCNEARYCSKACQTLHWKMEHRRDCVS